MQKKIAYLRMFLFIQLMRKMLYTSRYNIIRNSILISSKFELGFRYHAENVEL